MKHISGSTVWIFIQLVLIVCSSWGLSTHIETKVLSTSTSYEAVLENKKRSSTSLPAPFSAIWRRIFLMLYTINWPNFIICLHLFLEVLGNMWIVVISFPVYFVISFEINLSFLCKPFSYMTEKVKTKI